MLGIKPQQASVVDIVDSGGLGERRYGYGDLWKCAQKSLTEWFELDGEGLFDLVGKWTLVTLVKCE